MVSTRMMGWVKRKIHVIEGQTVKQGRSRC